MRTIIAPTDFSDISLNAVNYAADMAVALGANLLILHATKLLFYTDEISPETIPDEINLQNKLSSLRETVTKRTGNKLQVSSKLVSGDIEDELERICNYKNTPAVVMATRGQTLRELFLVGSITVCLSRNLRYPVLVVPEGLSFHPIRNILMATDLENLHDLPIKKISSVVTAFDAGLDIVYVYNNEDKFEVMSNRMSELSFYLKNLNPRFHFIKNNNVHEAILDFAQSNNSDLILTFPKKHTFFHKSNSKQFIFYSPVAVMSMK